MQFSLRNLDLIYKLSPIGSGIALPDQVWSEKNARQFWGITVDIRRLYSEPDRECNGDVTPAMPGAGAYRAPLASQPILRQGYQTPRKKAGPALRFTWRKSTSWG
jgi:hypothetical protein